MLTLVYAGVATPGSFAVALLVGAVGPLVSGAAGAEERPPNIVLLLSDNLGFGEIGAYGGGALRGAQWQMVSQHQSRLAP